MGYTDVVCGIHEYLSLETTRLRARGRRASVVGGASKDDDKGRVAVERVAVERARGCVRARVTRVERDATRAVSTATRDGDGDGDDARAVIRDVAGAV